MEQIKKHFTEAQDILTQFVNNPNSFKNIELAGQILVQAIQNGNQIISCGNGGSMCDAMHFAEELSGKYRNDRPAYPALSISDPAHISCVANDYGYEFVFSRMVEAIGRKGDVLFAISTSGNSESILNAIAAAKTKGMRIIGLTGNDGGKMAALCETEIRAPRSEYSDRAQEIHIKVIHALIDYVETNLNNI
ncbi:D-sedoheptulose 7-phosphate isomerase [Daejeonella sp.]|uniref:D-sedoheptulose 7-phosphate isomerase n=1 Tax=Daejeonella sp. TaxID=2805397 RepID=UPI0039831946